MLIRAQSPSESSALSLKDMGTEEQQKEGEKGTKSNTVEDNGEFITQPLCLCTVSMYLCGNKNLIGSCLEVVLQIFAVN